MTTPEQASGAAPFLAIDQGGHASRAVILEASGAVVAEGRTPIETERPRAGWVEHDPESLVRSVASAIEQAVALDPHRGMGLQAAGLATQRSTIVCFDRRSGEALSPVISWQDRRAARWLTEHGPDPERIHEETGLVRSPHYGMRKLRWCLDHLPAVQQAARESRLAFGPLVSFVLFRLLEERPFLADPANASRTLLWAYRSRSWSAELLDHCGLPAAALPRCVPSRFDFGHLCLPGGARVPLTVATGDQSAALYARGAPGAETAVINIGTGAFVQRPMGDRPVADQALLSSVVWQDDAHAEYVLEGTVNGAGCAVEQMAHACDIPQEGLWAEAEGWLAEEREPPLYLNGFSGLGSPYWVPDFPSRLVGAGDGPRRMVAVFESIAFLLAINLECLAAHPPALEQLEVTGGLARLDGLCQRLADLCQRPVRRPSMAEATIRGLGYLLAGRPPVWGGGDPLDCFEPRSNPPLHTRFRRWRRLLEDALPRRA